MLLGGGYSVTVDYYSLGITTYELATGHMPFGHSDMDRSEIFDEIMFTDISKTSWWDDIPKILQTVIANLTLKDPKKRKAKVLPAAIVSEPIFRDWHWGETNKIPAEANGLIDRGRLDQDFFTPDNIKDEFNKKKK